ncbi:Unknown protein [Striga hermonthica]|uniref:F-box domain-containing protein n=1 Tax=Striga hermonthica TaxID=68872 RepID=A0A9N7R5Q8_STRHE|nr:Unknown protein [Striga hermonthica]
MASIDRLSALPDEIISHILSFLPLKTSVSTRTLAARWRFLLAYALNIQFTDRPSSSMDTIYSDRKFEDVLRKILSQCEAHGHSVITLRLHREVFWEHKLQAYLETAFACKLKTLDLSLREIESLPLCVLTSDTLINLKIKFFDIKMKNITVCLPALKRLHIETAVLDGSLENLISGCPVLEEFTYIGRIEHVCHCISSSTMKRLVLECDFPYKVKIDTPALDYLSLRYDYDIPRNVSFGSMDSLIEAHIVVFHFDDDLYSRSLVEFVGRLSSVKEMSLCLWDWGWKAPEFTPDDLNINFHNLAKLTVKGDWRFISYFVEKANMLEVLNVIHYPEPKCEMEPVQLSMANSIMKLHNLIELELQVDWWFLTYFLEKADKLKVLIIRNNVYSKYKRKRWLMTPLQMPNCLSSHLKIVQIHELDGTDEHEVDMVRYFLKNAKVLERMELHCLAESVDRISSIERNSSFDRGSEKCEIVFYEHPESDND